MIFPEPYLNIFTIEGELFIDMTKFKNPVVSIKGYANSTAEKLVDALNECRNEYIDKGNTYNTTFKFVALDGTGGKDISEKILPNLVDIIHNLLYPFNISRHLYCCFLFSIVVKSFVILLLIQSGTSSHFLFHTKIMIKY